MNLRDNITPAVLTAATGLLTPFCPDLSPRSLVKALRAYQNDTTTTASAGEAKKPLTRKQAAELLSCSVQSITRYMNDGKLRRIALSPRSVRICPDSLAELLAGNAGTANGEG